MRWTLTFEVQRDDERLAQYTVTCRWRCFGIDDIDAETARHGLTTTRHGDAVVVRRTV